MGKCNRNGGIATGGGGPERFANGKGGGRAGRGARGGRSGRDGGRGGRSGGRCEGRGRGRGLGNQDAGPTPEAINMSVENQRLVHNLITTLGPSTGAAAIMSAPSDGATGPVDRADVERKTIQALVKKGFRSEYVANALQLTQAQAVEDGELNQTFNEQKRRSMARALDWLIINLPEGELPKEFNTIDVAAARKKTASTRARGGGSGGRGGRGGRVQVPSFAAAMQEAGASGQGGNAGEVDVANMAARLAKEHVASLTHAGFDPGDAQAQLNACGRDCWRALDKLCAARYPSKKQARIEAAVAVADLGAEVDELQLQSALEGARDEEIEALQAIFGEECRKADGANRWVLPANGAGVLGEGRLEIEFASHSLYPFQPPTRLAYRNDALSFAQVAAIAAATVRQACNMIGSPMLHELVLWVYDNAAAAVDRSSKAHARAIEDQELRDQLAGKGGAMARTFAKLGLNTRREEDEEQARLDRVAYLKSLMEGGEEAHDAHKGSVRAQAQVLEDKEAEERKLIAHQTQLKKAAELKDKQEKEKIRAERRALALARQQEALQLQEKALVEASLERDQRASTELTPEEAAAHQAVEAAKQLQAQARAQAEAARRAKLAKAESIRLIEDAKRKSEDPQFQAMLTARARLPVWNAKNDISTALATHQVVVVCGETGCGKTTQVPQFILDEAVLQGRGGAARLVCTQPRRISATSVAQRVAQERAEPLGRTVGYQIRLEAVKSSTTRLLFCTTGVLLRRLSDDSSLAGVSHVVVDEVHERSLDSDFLLVLLKELLPSRPDLKVVLMSATLDAGSFATYFGGAAVLHIPGFTHPVKEYYLEDVLHITGYKPEPNSEFVRKGPPGRPPMGAIFSNKEEQVRAQLEAEEDMKQIQLLGRSGGYSKEVVQTLMALDPEKINYDLVEKMLQKICLDGEEGAVLVFMPGLMEIKKVHDACKGNSYIMKATNDGDHLIGLHSSLSTAEQQLIFNRPEQGYRKIVIATNIAETSITIDDVVFVLDAGRSKENSYNPQSKMQMLVEGWVSKASAKQRRGRAGRVRPGQCFRLYTRFRHDHRMVDFQLPEIKRVPLESLCLQIKLQKFVGGVSGFLGKALEPPPEDAVAAAIDNLMTLQAFDSKQELTALGHHLAMLPVDPRVGKMLIYAAILGCIDPILTIAAALSTRSPFVAPLDKREASDQAKKSFAEAGSDLIAVFKAYHDCQTAKLAGGRGAERQFANENFLSTRALDSITDMRMQFKQLLQEAGFLSRPGLRGGAKGSQSSSTSGRDGCMARNCPPKQGGGRGGARRGGQSQAPSESDPDPENKKQLADPVVLANSNSHNMQLVTSLLCAGLYPNVARVEETATTSKGPPKPPKLVTKSATQDDKLEIVQVHPCSVNFSRTKYRTKWLIYHEKVKTSAVFLRDTTPVTPYTLLLFGGAIQVQHATGAVTIDKWIQFTASAKVAVLFKELRAKLDRLLADKIKRPDLDLWAGGKPVVDAILQLLDSERTQAEKAAFKSTGRI